MTGAPVPATPVAPRTYGNWRRPSSPGLPRLGLLGTTAALVALVLVMLVQLVAGLVGAAVTAALAVAAIAPLLWRNRAGRHGWQVATAKACWWWGRRRRQHLFSTALTGPQSFGATRLPGLLASSELLSAVTAYGEPFALVHLPATRHYAVLLACDPQGSQLVDPSTVDEWVAGWGQWLSRLGHEPHLVACSVTIETAPDPGSRLAAEVAGQLCPGAPALSVQVLQEIAAEYPRGSAALRGYLTLTFSADRPAHRENEGFRGRPHRTGPGADVAPPRPAQRVRSPAEMATLIGRRLPLLLHHLRGVGAGVGRPMTLGQVAETVRVAYDPAAAALLDRAHADFPAGPATLGPTPTGPVATPPTQIRPGQPGVAPAELVRWCDAGPVAQVEAWDHLRHDSGASITWQMVEPPRGAVQSRVLEALLEATDQLARKRVTVLYRPHDPASAARVADSDVRTAAGRAAVRPGQSRADETLALAAARQSAAEQAAGAGLVRFSLLVTATVAQPAQLSAAAEAIEQLGPACQLRLRRCYFNQAAAFTAALGVGVVLPQHVRVPPALRDHR